MEDEIILSGKYKDFSVEERFVLEGASEMEVAKVLEHLRSRIELPAYRYSGVNLQEIDKFVKVEGKGPGAVVSFLDSHPPGKTRKFLLEQIPEKKLYDAAESYLINALMRAAGVPYFPPLEKPSVKPEKEVLDGQIVFIAHYGKWMAIKKLTVEKAEDWEVSGILSKIHDTMISKIFDFAGAEADDDLAKKLCKGKRKSLGTLKKVLEELSKNLSGNKLNDAYLIKKVFDNLGCTPYPGAGMLVKAHPELKPKKPRGRAPKG